MNHQISAVLIWSFQKLDEIGNIAWNTYLCKNKKLYTSSVGLDLGTFILLIPHSTCWAILIEIYYLLAWNIKDNTTTMLHWF